jgi:hypothetical protein
MSTALTKVMNGLSPRGKEMISRYRNQIQRVKQEAERVADVGVSSVVTVAGGAAAGVLAAKMAKVPGTEIPSDVALGAACILGAMLGVGGKNNDHLASFGSGVLAVRAATEAAKMVK